MNPKTTPILKENTTLSVIYSSNVEIQGQAFDVDGNPVAGAEVSFVSDDGKISTTTQTKQQQGYYFINDVPINTPGTIQIKKDNLVSPQYKIGGGGGVYEIPTLYLENRIDIVGTVAESGGAPVKNTDIVVTTYTERNGEIIEENYYTKTDDSGEFQVYVQQNHKYSINVAIPGTTPTVYFTIKQEVTDEQLMIGITLPKSSETALATIELNGGSVNKGATGWTKVKAGIYTRTFALGSSYEAITSE